MRALHLTRDFPPRWNGGISTAVGGLVAASARAGIDGAVLSFDGWRPRAAGRGVEPVREQVGAAEVLRVSEPAHLPAARAFAAEVRPTLLHVHADLVWELAAELRAELGVPALLHVHVLQSHQNRLRGIGATRSSEAQARALAEADHLIAPSQAVADLLAAEHPDTAGRVEVVPFGIDPVAPPDFATRERDLVVYAGRFADINGTAELIDAIPRIPGARFVIAGGLPDNPKSDRRWRRRFPPGVELPGWLTPAEVGALFDRCAVAVIPSWFETFGLVVLEAMAHGAPIVASDAGAIPELVRHDDSAFLVPPGDPQALATAIARLLADPDLAARLGGRAARGARERFTWAGTVERLAAVYR
jgi:glycosyltransferase involved in cell wall biosynthesis